MSGKVSGQTPTATAAITASLQRIDDNIRANISLIKMFRLRSDSEDSRGIMLPETSINQDKDPIMKHKTAEILNIHQRLQDETENIARWKASTEVKTKQLERQLQESQSVIEDQRSNLMELQLHSEQLSQNLLRERQERELVITKVTYTRQLFSNLEEQYEQLLKTTKIFQQVKDSLTSEHMDIIKKLKDLQEASQGHQNSIQNHILREEKNTSLVEKLKEEMNHQISAKDKELAALTQKLKHLEEMVANLSENLSATENDRSALNSRLDKVLRLLTETQEEMKKQTDALASQLVKVEDELKCEQIRLKESQKEFEEAVEKIQYLKKSNDTLEGAKSELLDKVEALTSRKQELEQEIIYKAEVIATQDSAHSKSVLDLQQLNERIVDLCAQQRNEELEKERIYNELGICKKNLTCEELHVKQLKEEVTILKETIKDLEQMKVNFLDGQETLQKENLDMSQTITQLKEKLTEMGDIVLEVKRKLTLSEEQEEAQQQQILSLEEQITKSSKELVKKTKEYENVAKSEKEHKTKNRELKTAIKELKTTMKKNKLEESKMQEEKIISLKRELKAITDSAHALDDRLKEREEMLATLQEEVSTREGHLNDGLTTIEELKLELAESLSKHEKVQCELESKEKSLKILETSMRVNMEKLLSDLNQKEEHLSKSHNFHEQEIQKLKHDLEKTQEDHKNSSIAHEKEIKETTEALTKDLLNKESIHQEETEKLKAEMKKCIQDQQEAREEASAAIKEKLQTKLESDGKVKEMVGLLDRYKNEKETKLKNVEQQLLDSQAQIAQVTSEKESQATEIKNLKSEIEELRMQTVSLQTKNEVTRKAAVSETVFKTPSPAEYFKPSNTFIQPQTPDASRIQKKSEAIFLPSTEDAQQTAGILKTGRRMLLPNEKKRVVFRTSCGKGETSGDSSSDANVFEIADSDDAFEEVKRHPRRLPFVGSDKIPKANIVPIVRPTTKTSDVNSSQTSTFVIGQKNKSPSETLHKKKKKVKLDTARTYKTYSSISPRQKQGQVDTPSTSSTKKDWIN